MQVTVMRIDDRLIHGQIITVWSAYSEAKTIIVADDKAVADPFQRSLLQLAIPSGIELKIESIESAIGLLKEDQSEQKVMLIVRRPADALKMVKAGYNPGVINVGNISNFKSATGRKKLLDYINPEPQDVEDLKELASLGVKLEVRAIPNERVKDAIELLKNY